MVVTFDGCEDERVRIPSLRKPHWKLSEIGRQFFVLQNLSAKKLQNRFAGMFEVSVECEQLRTRAANRLCRLCGREPENSIGESLDSLRISFPIPA